MTVAAFRVGLAVIADGRHGSVTKVVGDAIRVLHDDGRDEWYGAELVRYAEPDDAIITCERCAKTTTDPDLWDPDADTGRIFCDGCWDHRDDDDEVDA